MEMRPGRVARRADIADGLALRDVRAIADGDARLVAVGRRDPASVVDDDDIAVAAQPARVDDGARSRGPDGSARWDGDVDAFVHPPPTPAEGARDRPQHRPDE